MLEDDVTNRSIWITWEQHRRSHELARALNARLCVLESSAPPLVRYCYLSLRTVLIILRTRPTIVFAQNPSMVLATLVCMLRGFLRLKVIIDRHSNFELHTVHSREWRWRLFHLLSRYTVRRANLTIVSNAALKAVVDSWCGHGFVLQDKLPELPLAQPRSLQGKRNIVLVSSFSDDEPILEAIDAARKIDSSWIVYVTGNHARYKQHNLLPVDFPANVRLTGFLEQREFQSLLVSADLIVVLTIHEDTLTCGAYEGASLSKPLVLSDTRAIREYFTKGVVYTKADSAAIANAIQYAIANHASLLRDIKEFKGTAARDWNRRFTQLRESLSNL